MAASNLGDRMAREQLALMHLEDGDFRTAAETYDEVFQQQRGALNAMLAAEAYDALGQSDVSALRKTIAFVFWHDSYRSQAIISSFAEMDRLERMADFLQVYVCVPGSERVSDERYRNALAGALHENDPVNEAICLQISLLDLFETDSPSSRQLTWWAQTARQLTIARAAAQIADQDFDRLIRNLRNYNNFRPGDPEIAEKIVPSLDAAGEPERAQLLFELATEFYLEVLPRYPRSPLLHNNYAWICACGQRRLKYALRHCEIAVQAVPMNSSYLDTFAEISFLLGNKEIAIEASRKCKQLNPGKQHYKKQLERFRHH